MKTYEKELSFSGLSGPAVVVEPETPWSFVFWRGAQYVGCIDLGGNVWFTAEWLETNSPEDHHCYEPIMDKQCKYSYAKILETGEARAKVKWHYACCNVKYEIFHGNTEADEYYTVYPDGIAVRRLVAWPGDQSDFGGNANFWQVLEYILINGVGSRPDNAIEKNKAFTMMNEKGEKIELEWPLPDVSLCDKIRDWKMYIGKIGLRERASPFVAFIKDQRFFPYKPCIWCKGDHPNFHIFHDMKYTFKHWPASDMENFCLAVEAQDDEIGRLATHTSFIDCNYSSSHYHLLADAPPRPSTWLFLVGASPDSNDETILEMVKSWARPAKIETGYESRRIPWGLSYGPVLYEGYSHSERAYVFRLEGTDKLKFKLTPTEKVINPVIKVENWNGKKPVVSVNEDNLPESSFRWQFDGRFLIIWINSQYTLPTYFAIE